MSDVIDTLEGVNVHDRIAAELTDGTTIEGVAAPVNFDPDERLRIEIRPDEGDDRYDLTATAEDGEWSPVEVRRQSGDDDWESVGELAAVNRENDDSTGGDSGASGA